MADAVSKGSTYSAAACTLSVVCAAAVLVSAGVGLGAGIAKDFVFDQNPASFFADFGVDKSLEKIGADLANEKYKDAGRIYDRIIGLWSSGRKGVDANRCTSACRR